MVCLCTTLSYAVQIKVDCPDETIAKDAKSFFTENIDLNSLYRSVSISVKRYYYRWPIENIIVVWDDPDIIRIRVIPDFVITDIKVRGAKTIKKREVIRQVRVFENTYKGVEVKNAIEKYLGDYYAYRGFPQAHIKAEFVQNKSSGSLSATIEIEENESCQFDDVITSGLDVDEKRRLASKLRRKLKSKCDQKKLERVLKNTREKYVSNLYRRVEIVSEGFVTDEEGPVELVVNIDKGMQIDVQFFGNTFLFERDELLKNAIFLDQETKFNEVWVQATAKEAILSFYQAQGYPYANVEAKDEFDLKENRRTIRFLIDRGPIMRVGEITYLGNENISDLKLASQFTYFSPLKTRRGFFVEKEIETVVDRLISYYQSNGFLRATIKEPDFEYDLDNHQVNVRLAVVEGKQTTFEDIEIKGNNLFSKKDILKTIKFKKDDPVNPLLLKNQTKELEREYKKRGYKYADVQYPSLADLPEGKIMVPILVDEGAKITLGDIIVRGNFITKERVVMREVVFDSGDIYNISDIERTRGNLFRLGFFQSVTILERPRDDLQGVEDIIIQIRERKQRILTLRPGISTDDGYRIASTIGYTNIAGTGRSATLSGRLNRQVTNADILEHRLIFTYLEPSIFNYVDFKISLISEQADEVNFDISRNSLILGLERLWSLNFRTTVQWELERRNPFNLEPDIVLSPLDETEARFGSLASIIDVDFRDNILNAERGTYHRLRFEYFDQAFLSDEEFYRLTLTNNFYVPIYRRIRSILSVRLGFSGTLGVTAEDDIEQVPIEKRYRLGGNNSLRGYQRNCVGGLPAGTPENCSDTAVSEAPGGNSLFNYLLEFLFPVNDTVDFVLFTDGGNAFLTNSDFDVTNIRQSVGFGLRYNTFVGPLRIDYGIKLDRRTGESFGQLHFAVGQF